MLYVKNVEEHPMKGLRFDQSSSFPRINSNYILEQQFVCSIKLNIPPNDNMSYYELDWFYSRYLSEKKKSDA